ncbi:50S ribosomal protein L6 [Allorhodopirellula solitaria]|uniref:Large ribosomal subunit protein uL6 n=1 Tax=Allorhodopirellula solitaria TaxID=2527987 RepID=A0A5C5YFV1_9BACT|nr:50S ribosomal protein L6 [Allorhodopirellula solitaria]TWT73918.1 50S ribosomal protein L6 [Allorhodopirellula solitaria]
MSRIGKKPIAIPAGVTIAVNDRTVNVEGPKGKLTFTHRPEVSISVDSDANDVSVTRADDSRPSREFHGLTRAIVANMVEGVTQGYEKKLEIVGVGYLASISGDTLQLRVGFANELHRKIPADLTVTCPDQTHVVVQGCDKQRVGQFAADIRSLRKPEPYKGKGVRYQGEYVKIKPGKSATK